MNRVLYYIEHILFPVTTAKGHYVQVWHGAVEYVHIEVGTRR